MECPSAAGHVVDFCPVVEERLKTDGRVVRPVIEIDRTNTVGRISFGGLVRKKRLGTGGSVIAAGVL